jgi:hypothetical protein
MKTFREISRSLFELVALILLFSHFYPLSHYCPIAKFGDKMFEFGLFMITVVFFSLAAIVNTIITVRKEKLVRNSKFVRALPLVNDAFTEIHTALGNKNSSSQVYILSFRAFCNRLSQAFTDITGERCHACIKVSNLTQDAAGNFVYVTRTIAREKLDPNNPLKPSRDINDREHIAQISDNTDFNEIFYNIENNKSRFFFSNSLPKRQRKGYRNSSFLYHGMPITGPVQKKVFLFFKKWEKWPLPYKSTFVAAICPSIATQHSKDPIAGFLCIDSANTSIFIMQDDISLVIGCANGLFNAIREYNLKAEEEAEILEETRKQEEERKRKQEEERQAAAVAKAGDITKEQPGDNK